MEQNKYYLLGREFISYTDHRPLLSFYNNKKKATPRIQNHLLRVQDLNFRMEFLAGKKNPSDWYSRHPEDITEWSERVKESHGIDRGEEIRLKQSVGSAKNIPVPP